MTGSNLTLSNELRNYYPDRCRDCSRCILAVVAAMSDAQSGKDITLVRRSIMKHAVAVNDNCLYGQDIVLSDPPITYCNYREPSESAHDGN